MKIVKPDKKFDNISLSQLGRRPTTIHDIKGLLTLLDKTNGNFLEIGTWYGRTIYELAIRFPKKIFYTIDFLDIQLSYEIAMNTRASKENLCCHAKHLPNVKFEYIESSKFNYADKKITIVFIDGDHSEEGVKKDTDLALQNLEPGSIICWHDSLNGVFGVPYYLQSEIDRKFNRFLFENSQLSYIQL